MSLINEALKKAQKQRTGEAPTLGSMPTIGGESPRRIAGRTGSDSLNTLLVRLGLGAVGLVIVGVGAVLLFRQSPSTPAPATAQPAAVTQAATPAPAAPAPAPAKSSETVFVLPIAAPPAPTKPAPVAPQPESKVITAKPVVVPAAPPVEPHPEPVRAPAAPSRLPPAAIQFIDSLRVAGIRASATDSKVLMNDRVYRIGDIVEHDLGLRLVGITSSSLTFEDDSGARHTRNF